MKGSRLGAIASLMESNDTEQSVKAITGSHDTRAARVEVRQVPVGDLDTSPWQPRTAVDLTSADFAALVASVAEHGVMQPVVVRELPDKALQLIAGERRLRAAQRAGLRTIPARVYPSSQVSEAQAHAMAVVENLARTDLSTWEEARALGELQRIRIAAKLERASVRDLSTEVGRPKTTVARLLSIARAITPEIVAAAYDKAGADRRKTVDDLTQTDLLTVADAAPDTRVGTLATLLSPIAPSARTADVVPPTPRESGDTTASPRAPFVVEGEIGKRMRVKYSGRVGALSPSEAQAFHDALQPLMRALRARARGAE